MIKYIAIALVGLGIFIGITYGDDIKSMIEGDPIENAQDQLQDAAGDLADKVSDTFN